MYKKRKAAALLAAAVMTVGMASCGSSGSTKAVETNAKIAINSKEVSIPFAAKDLGKDYKIEATETRKGSLEQAVISKGGDEFGLVLVDETSSNKVDEKSPIRSISFMSETGANSLTVNGIACGDNKADVERLMKDAKQKQSKDKTKALVYQDGDLDISFMFDDNGNVMFIKVEDSSKAD